MCLSNGRPRTVSVQYGKMKISQAARQQTTRDSVPITIILLLYKFTAVTNIHTNRSRLVQNTQVKPLNALFLNAVWLVPATT